MRNFHALFVTSVLAASAHVALAETDITAPYVTSIDGQISNGVWNFLNDGTNTNGSLNADSSYGVQGSSTQVNFFGESFATISQNYGVYQASLTFHDDSALSFLSTMSYGIYYGNANFLDRSSVDFSVNSALYVSNATFGGQSSAVVSAAYGISYGDQTFSDHSTLSVTASYGVYSNNLTFEDNASAVVSASSGIRYSTAVFKDDSSLTVSGLYGFGYSTIRAGDNTSISVNSSYGLMYSTIELSGQSQLTANTLNAVAGSTLKLSDDARVELSADNALESGDNFVFDKSAGGSGGTLTLNGHSTQIGLISSVEGGGVIRNGGASDAVLTLASYDVGSEFGGIIEDGGSGKLSLNKRAGSAVTLSGANTYTGTTTISDGMLVAANDHALGSVSEGTTINSGGTLGLKGNLNLAEPLNFSGGRLLNISGDSSVSGSITMEGSNQFTVSEGSLTIDGAISTPSSAGISADVDGLLRFSGTMNLGTQGVLKAGKGTLVFNGASTTVLGGLDLQEGQTILDFANMAIPENLVFGSATLVMGGGSLKLLGKDLANTSQSFSSLHFQNGVNQIALVAGAGAQTDLSVGTIFRSAGAVGSFLLPAGTRAFSSDPEGTLGFATVTDEVGTGLARIQGGEIVRLTGQTPLAADSNDAAVDFVTTPMGASDAGTPYLTMDGDFSVSSLTIDTSLATGANVLDLGGHTMSVASSGLLMQGGNDFTILGGHLGAADQDLYIHTLGDGTLTITGGVSGGGGSLVKTGNGTLVLTGQSDFSGRTFVHGGTLEVMDSAALGTSNSVVLGAQTAMILAGGVDLAADMEFQSGLLHKLGGASSSLGYVRSAGDLAIQSDGGLLGMYWVGAAGDLVMSGEGDFQIAASSYARTLTKDGGGKLTINSDFSVTGSGATIHAGTIQIGSGGTSGTLNANTVNNGSIVFNRSDAILHSYTISGTGSVEIVSGKVGLDAPNSYTGGTKVSGGTLSVRQNGATGTGSVTVDAGAALEGNSEITGEVLLSGAIAPGISSGAGPSIGTLSAAAMTWNGGGSYQWEITEAVQNWGRDQINVGGMLNIAATELNPFTISINSFDAGTGMPGAPANFDPYVDFNWTIASAGSVDGFDSAKFVLDSTGFHSPVAGGEFALSQNGGNIVLNYIGITRDIDGVHQTSVDGVLTGKWNVRNDGVITHGGVLADSASGFASNAKVRFLGESYLNASVAGAVSGGNLLFYDDAVATAGVAGAISGGQLEFNDSSSLVAAVAGAVSGGTLIFRDDSSVSITVAGAVANTAMSFYGNSHLDLDVASALSTYSNSFNDNAVLNVNVANALNAGSFTFHDNAKLNAASGSITGGSVEFYGSSALELLGSSAISGGFQYFNDNTRLKPTVQNAITGGYQYFKGNSVLELSTAGVITGGYEYFYDDASIELTVDSGSLYLTFYGNSSGKVSGTGSITAGGGYFNDQSKLEVSTAHAIEGGYLSFSTDSALEATASEAINGGAQYFNGNSVLEAAAARAITGGNQYFYNSALLKATVGDAVNGGNQNFNDNSILKASVADAVSGGHQAFDGQSKLQAEVAGAVSGGTQYFSGESTLEIAAAGAINGGTQTFASDATIEIAVAGGISGGTQIFAGNKDFDVDLAGAVTGGEQWLSGRSLNANVTNGLSGNTIGTDSGGRININAENAVNGSNIKLTYGTLALNGHNVTVGGLSEGYGGQGVITNESASNVVLTVSPVSGSFDYSGTISETDGTISLVKTGAGMQILSSANSYSGGTTVSGGRLSVRADGATGSGNVIVESAGTLEGINKIDGEAFISGTVSPGIGGAAGVSIGTLSAQAMTWNGGGTYLWEINNATNGSWDRIGITDALNIASTSANPFTISVQSFDSLGDPGTPVDFNPYYDYTWGIASAGEVTGFDATKFVLDTTGFQSPVSGGDFKLSLNGNDLVISYIGITREIDGLYQTSTDGVLDGKWNVLNNGDTTHGRLLADTAGSITSSAMVRFYGESYADISVANAVNQGTLEFHDQSEARILAGNGISGGRQVFLDDSVARAEAQNAISGGQLEFNDSSKLIASENGAVSGGMLTFRDDASFVATAEGAINAGLAFYGASHLDLEAGGALASGGADFHDNAVLNAAVENAISNYLGLNFYDNSKLKASAGSVTAGFTSFYNSSSLEASEAMAVNGGFQDFYGSSVLKAVVEDSVRGGFQTFHGNSSLEASVTRAVTGGGQTFYDDSTLKVSAKNAVEAYSVYFYEHSALEFSGEGTLEAGNFYFYDNSQLKASAAGVVSGGTQNFNGNSSLEATVSGALSGGTQNFYDHSRLDALVDGAVSGGTQSFYGDGLQIDVAGAISGGTQYFYNDSTLDITVAGGVRGGTQYFVGNKNFDVDVANAVVGGEQIVQGVSLNANVTNALSGGTIRAASGSTINVNANNAINGSNIAFEGNGSLALNGHNATVGGINDNYNWSPGSIGSASASSVVLTIAPTSGSWSYYGNIAETDGAISVVKGGAGMQFLSGDNSYTGGTTISGGQLFANSNTALGTGLVTVESGGTLGGSATLANTVIVSGTVSPGYEPGSRGTLTTGSETWNGGGSYLWDIAAYYDYDILQINGTLSLTNTADDRFTIKVDSHGVLPFDPYNNYSWDIVTTSDGISGFDASAFRIDTSDFVSPGGSFKLVMDGNLLRLEFIQATHQVTDTLVVNSSNPIYGQVWEVLNDGTTTHGNMVVSGFYSLYGGDINFRGQSQLEAATYGAIYGGTQIFNDESKLLVSAQNAILSGEQTFNDNSTFEIASGGSLGGGTQTSNDNSKLNVVDGALNGGTQNFYDSSVLTIGENGFLSGGTQTFRDSSSLVFSSENAMGSNDTKFYDESSFVLDSENLDTGSASVKFYDTSKMKFTSGGKLNGGNLYFYGSSSLVADKTEAVTGGAQDFHESSKLVASSEDAIVGGEQNFDEQASLKASGAKAINGGTQRFAGDSYLEASAAHAVYGGVQNFNGSAKLKATAADSIDGGHQYFNESSSLDASASAILSGIQDFGDSAGLNANGASSVKGGTQQFYGDSTLFATVSNAVTGGEQHLYDYSSIEANAVNSVNGGLQLIGGNGELNANVTGSVGAANIVLFGPGRVAVNANNALTSSTNVLFNGIGGVGGVLELNGHSTTVGKIESENGGGTIRNSTDAATLTVSISSGRSTYEGIIEDGSAALAIVKEGLGELELTGGGNSYSGGTTINAGTLIVNNVEGSATGSGNVLVGANGTLAGSGIIGGSVTVQGKLSPGNSPGLLSIEGDLTLASGSVTTMQIAVFDPDTAFDQIWVGGTLNYGGTLNIVLENSGNGLFDLFNFNVLGASSFSAVTVSGYSLTRNDHLWTGAIGESEFTFDELSGEFLAVPEPSIYALMALGISAIVFVRRRKVS
jgi:autotransporter-associated beta strand protein